MFLKLISLFLDLVEVNLGSEKLSYVCTNCGSVRDSQTNLGRHMKWCHKCGLCDRIFKKQEYLNTHLERIHFIPSAHVENINNVFSS